MSDNNEKTFLEFLDVMPEEKQDPVSFFEWAGFNSRKEGHACAVWKTAVRSLGTEKAIVLETRWAESKERRKEYWEKLRTKEEADKKMEEWCKRIENFNSAEKDIVIEFQHQKFKAFVDNKISPFIVKDEPSPPYTSSHHPSKRLREDFAGGSDSSWEVLTEGDIVDALQEMRPHQNMGKLLGVKHESVFSCVLENFDMGAHFTQYFKACCLESFKHVYPEDALVLSATLLIKRDFRSPRLLKAFGGQRLTSLRDTLLKTVIPVLNATILEKQQALMSRWVGWVGIVSENRNENLAKRMNILDRLHSDWGEAKDLDLTALFTYIMTCIQELSASQPLDFLEADGIASFVRNLLSAFLQEVDLVRFSCADKGSAASRYNKTINHLQGRSKQPDMVGNLTYEGIKVESFFGEASSVVAKDPSKYGGDTVRLGVFGKNSHDMIDNLLDLEVPLLLFNIDGLLLQAFILKKVQGIYVMMEIGTGRIPCSINDLIYLSQDLPFWLKLREIARKTSASIVQAVDDGQVDHERRKSFYPTITTPSARSALNSAK
ncbi:hypothetical protein BGZ76_000732 [Entomortierella beljakovae]|nr:hypothetical protein BGZ76_000732 [Entomortierella beljakovae]